MDRDKNSFSQDRGASQIANQAAEKIVFTTEELRVLKSCNRDSFYYRCLPLGIAFVGATHLAVMRGVLKPNPRYGSSLKCLGAWLGAYGLGKLSFQGECRERILRLENSPLAEKIRQTNKYSSSGTSKDLYGDKQPDSQDPPSSLLPRNRNDTQNQSSNSNEGSIYDDLRDKNRQQYQRKPYQPSTKPPTSQSPSHQPSQPPPSKPNRSVRRNAYGDIIDE